MRAGDAARGTDQLHPASGAACAACLPVCPRPAQTPVTDTHSPCGVQDYIDWLFDKSIGVVQAQQVMVEAILCSVNSSRVCTLILEAAVRKSMACAL